MSFEELKKNADDEWEAFVHRKKPQIFLGSACQATDTASWQEQIETELKDKNIDARIHTVGCLGWYDMEPLVGIAKPDQPVVWYSNTTPEKLSTLISECLIQDKPLSEGAVFCMGEAAFEGIPAVSQLPMFEAQKRIALRNCGRIDPENIHHYIALGGYAGLAQALKMSPEQIIDEIKKSGLRGKGGAGYPSAEKWRTCLEAAGGKKYVICNAAEGDPESFKDRMLLEGDPHAVLEGMVINAYAVGAKSGFIYINETYESTIKRLRIALDQMAASGLLGKKILGSEFGFNLEIKEAPAGLASGEETAMISTMEGKRTSAYKRPPYPAQAGFEGKPTCVHNVETYAHVSAILEKGADHYTETKVFTLAGKVTRSGIIEIPLEMPLRRIIDDIGGGIKDNKPLKAVRIGGSTGGWLIEEHLDNPLTYEFLAEVGTIMGSGGIRVEDDGACAVDLARQALAFIETENCGKCVFGREGTMQLAEILTDICKGRARATDIDLLVDLGRAIKEGAFCGLCKSAPNPVLTTIQHFREEYEAHVKGKKCPAGVCFK